MSQQQHVLGSLMSDESFDPTDRDNWPRTPQNRQDRLSDPDDGGHDYGDEDDYLQRHPNADDEPPGRIAD